MFTVKILNQKKTPPIGDNEWITFQKGLTLLIMFIFFLLIIYVSKIYIHNWLLFFM